MANIRKGKGLTAIRHGLLVTTALAASLLGDTSGITGSPILALGMNLNWLTYWTSQGVMVDLVPTQDGITGIGTGFDATGDTTAGSYTVANIASMANITKGMVVTGPGIDESITTLVTAVGASSVTLSTPATGTNVDSALHFTFNGAQVPDAYLDANGMPNAYPPGINTFQVILNQSVTSKQHKMVWTGSLLNPTFGNVFSGVGAVVGNSITVTPAALQSGTDAYTYFRWQIPGGGSYATSLSCRPVVDPGTVVSPEFTALMKALTSPTGYIRPIHMSAAETVRREDTTVVNKALVDPTNDKSYPGLRFPTDANGQLLGPILTSANRNTLANINYGRRDKTPVELFIHMANDADRNLKWNGPLNADDTYYNAIFDLVLNGDAAYQANPATGTPPLKAGLKFMVTVSNESSWNDGDYIDAWQFKNEGADLGITWHQRYAQVNNHVFQLAIAAFTAAGRRADLVTCLEYQEAGDPSVWDEMLDFETVDANTDMLSVAIYWGPDSVDLNGAVAPTAAQVRDASYAGADTSFAQAKLHYDHAATRGKPIMFYEGGLSIPADGAHSALQESITVSPEMHDAEAYGLNEFARIFGPNSPWCNFSLTGSNGFYREWGIIDTIATEVSSSPKAQAIKEFNAGEYTFFPMTFTGGLIDAASPVGTVAATIVKHHPGATLTLVDPNDEFELSGLDIVSKVSPLTVGSTVHVTQASTGSINGPITTDEVVTVVSNDAGASTWNPVDKDAGIILSAGNVNAAGTNADTNVRAVRSISGLATGKYYWELGRGANVGHERMGLGTLAALLGQHVGQDAHSVGWDSNGGVYVNGSVVGGVGNTFGWNVTGCAVDLDAKLCWFRLESGSWIGATSGADPVTGAHGIDISSLGSSALHPMWSVNSVAGSSGLVALQVSGNNTYPPPTGFSLWPTNV